ncbi:hypothetical protein HMI55_002397, partial [Coelomomyces lativittatus]
MGTFLPISAHDALLSTLSSTTPLSYPPLSQFTSSLTLNLNSSYSSSSATAASVKPPPHPSPSPSLSPSPRPIPAPISTGIPTLSLSHPPSPAPYPLLLPHDYKKSPPSTCHSLENSTVSISNPQQRVFEFATICMNK